MTEIETIIKQSGAIKRGKFKLSNGSLTDYYIDKYVFEADPTALRAITKEVANRIDSETIDVIAGPELGAIPLVTALSLETNIPAAFIRRGDKHYGTQARIEGSIEKGKRAAIVEDVTTTGNTVLDTIKLVEEVGGIIERVFVVVDRNEGAVQHLQNEGYELEYLIQVGEDLIIERDAKTEE